MAVRSKTTIFKAALYRTGNDEASNGPGSFLWLAMEVNYDEIVRRAFEGQEYPFGRAEITLTGRLDGQMGYDDAFQLPSEVLHVEDVRLNGYRAADLGEPWDVDGEANTLLINANEMVVRALILKKGAENRWSATFAGIIQKRLEAVIKDAIEEPQEALLKDQMADVSELSAGVKASRNRSQRRARKGGRLIRAHGRR